jgi:sulfur carrier protein
MFTGGVTGGIIPPSLKIIFDFINLILTFYQENKKMKLRVSGNQKDYADGLTVSQLIELEKVETPMYVTVSINDEFVESGAFAKTALHDGDSVEFLYFMGGGR